MPGAEDTRREAVAWLASLAKERRLSAKTVEAHVSAVLRKLQLSNRHELSRWAVQRGWLE